MRMAMKSGEAEVFADGIRADVGGNVWAGAGWVGAGYDGVHIFAPDGQRIGRILLPEICANLFRRPASKPPLHDLEAVAVQWRSS